MMAMEITLDKDKIYSENTMDFKQMEYRMSNGELRAEVLAN